MVEYSRCRSYYFCLSQRKPVQRNFLSVTQMRAEAHPGCAGYLSRSNRVSATLGSDLYRSLGFNDKYKVLHLSRNVTEEIKSLTRSPWKAICTAITKHRYLCHREPVDFRGLIYNLLEIGHYIITDILVIYGVFSGDFHSLKQTKELSLAKRSTFA